MILVVTGGRTYTLVTPTKPICDADAEAADLIRALDLSHARRPITRLVHGDARGADKASGEWARMRGVDVEAVPVDHALDGPWPGAGPRRNGRMLARAIELASLLSEPNPLGCAAFPGGRGTANMVDQLTRAGYGDRIWRPYG